MTVIAIHIPTFAKLKLSQYTQDAKQHFALIQNYFICFVIRSSIRDYFISFLFYCKKNWKIVHKKNTLRLLVFMKIMKLQPSSQNREIPELIALVILEYFRAKLVMRTVLGNELRNCLVRHWSLSCRDTKQQILFHNLHATCSSNTAEHVSSEGSRHPAQSRAVRR